MRKYIATYRIEIELKHFEEHIEQFTAEEDSRALDYVRARLPALKEEHMGCSSISLIKLIETKKVDIRGL